MNSYKKILFHIFVTCIGAISATYMFYIQIKLIMLFHFNIWYLFILSPLSLYAAWNITKLISIVAYKVFIRDEFYLLDLIIEMFDSITEFLIKVVDGSVKLLKKDRGDKS